MQTFAKWVHVEAPETAFLEDLASAHMDLSWVKKYLQEIDLLAKTAESSDRRHVVLAALAEAAVIKYARCFVSGVRTPIDLAVFYGAPSRLKTNHQYFLEIRHRYIAHSVSNLEQVAVVVGLDKLRGRYKVGDVGELFARSSPFGRLNHRALHELVDWVQEAIEYLSELERKEIQRMADELGPAILQTLPQPRALFKAFQRKSHLPRKRREA